MLGYSVSCGTGRIAAGETDQLWIPRTPRPGKCGLVLLHGSGNPSGYIDPVNQPASQKLAAALARSGIPCVSGAMGNQTWANDTAMNRIDSAIALLRAQVLAVTGVTIHPTKHALLGESMGGALGARYGQLHADKVAVFVGIIPLLDLTTFYPLQTSAVQTEIETAWGVGVAGPLPNSANIAANAYLAATVPSRFWYSGSDTTVLPAWVTNYASVVAAQATDVGTNGHSDATIGQVPIPDVGKFLVANGC